MRTPQQLRSSASADRMLDATLALLAEGGLAEVTVAGVAQRSGSSNGSLYHRFGDRAGLLAAAHERALELVGAETAEAFARADAEPDDDDALLLLAKAALGIFARYSGAVRVFLVEAATEDAVAARNRRANHALAGTVTAWLRERFGAGAAEAEAAWRILFALGAAQALVPGDQVSPVDLARHRLARAVADALGAVVRPRG